MTGSYGGEHRCPECDGKAGIVDYYCRWCGQTLRDGGHGPESVFDRVAYWKRRLQGAER